VVIPITDLVTYARYAGRDTELSETDYDVKDRCLSLFYLSHFNFYCAFRVSLGSLGVRPVVLYQILRLGYDSGWSIIEPAQNPFPVNETPILKPLWVTGATCSVNNSYIYCLSLELCS